MPQAFSNNASSRLVNLLTAESTTIEIEAGDGSKFPTANTGPGVIPTPLQANSWFKLTLQDFDGRIEVVYVCTKTADTFANVLRGQEGTLAQSFSAGAVVGLRPTAADFQFIYSRL